MSRACVIGSGPNGLAAAIVLAQAGMRVEVFEAEAEPGGAVRTLPLTLPGFLHDFGSAVYPFAAGSPFFSALPLADHGLEWIHGEVPLAHPLDDGSAVVLERDLEHAERSLGADGKLWRSLMQPAADDWKEFAEDTLGPALRMPHHPLRMARFGLTAFQSAQSFAKSHFVSPRTRAIFAGLAGHSFLGFDQPLSATIGWMFGITVHAVGWPIPRGGAQAITQALIDYLKTLGGTVQTSCRVDAARFRELEASSELVLFDTAPRQLVEIAGDRLSPKYRNELERFKPLRVRSRSTTHFRSPFRGARQTASEQLRFMWADRLRRLRRLRIPLPMGAKPNGRLCWWRSQRSTMPRARRMANMFCGPIATCPTDRLSI